MVRDMSRMTPEKKEALALRKRRQRARLKQSGKTKFEVWLTESRRTLIGTFATRINTPPSRVAQMVMEFATPLYLRELQKRMDRAIPLYVEVLKYEHYGVLPSPTGQPVRIGFGTDAIILDPVEHHRLRETLAPVLAELSKYGLPTATIRKIARGLRKRELNHKIID